MTALPPFAGLLLAATSLPGWAIDPPTVQGYLDVGGKQFALRYAQAVRSPEHRGRIWILLTTEEVSVTNTADATRTRAIARQGTLRGIRLDVDAVKPNAGQLRGVLLLGGNDAQAREIAFDAHRKRLWERLVAGDRRIVGTLRFAREPRGDVPAWSIDVSFSAPVFNPR